MKQILVMMAVMVVGCGKTETETEKTESKSLSPAEKLVGSYIQKRSDGKTFKHFFLNNGKGESYRGVEEESGWRWEIEEEGIWYWKIVENEVYLELKKSYLTDNPNNEQPYMACRVETNGDLTGIAFIVGEKRMNLSKENQTTLKKQK